jgi:hypothetical protein
MERVFDLSFHVAAKAFERARASVELLPAGAA